MIPLMNTSRQYESIKDELDKKALSILHSGLYIMGEEVESFEKKFAEYNGTKYAVGVGNGTDALVIALLAAGVSAGDEVITVAMSFFATAEAIAAVGAIPVFVDCTSDTYTLDPSLVESKITPKTKAIIPVHIYGQCADMDRINSIAKAHGLKVIEDCAQAVGSTYKGKKAGTLGDVGCFSFFPTKNLGCCGDGGMIITDNEDIYKRCLAYRVHGSGVNGRYIYNNGVEVGSEEEFHGHLPKYFNYVIGYNSRLDALQAGLLSVKLPHLDSWNTARKQYAKEYDKEITNPLFTKPHCSPDCSHVYYVYVICVEDRERFMSYMKNEKGISTSVYFPVPLHLQKAFEELGYKKGDMPNAEYVADHSVAIPMFPELTDDERRAVISAVNSFK